MKKWLVGWLSGPLTPLLLQVYKVLTATENSVNEILKKVTELGVPTDTPIFDTIKTVITAVIAVKVAIVKITTFLGVELPSQGQLSLLSLEQEIDELKKIL